jgi:hypothetical protein
MKKLIVLAILFIFNITTVNSADSQDNSFTYQGELLINNQPFDGMIDMAVYFYDAETNGNVITNDSFPDVIVTKGIFILMIDIGSGTFSGDKVWLELVIDDGTILNTFPRQHIKNAPYAIHALSVGEGGVNSAAIQSGAVTTSDIANSAVETHNLANGVVTTAKLANASVTIDKQANNSVNSDKVVNGSLKAIDVDTNEIQATVTGTCSAGSSIRQIGLDGSVICETDDTGTSGWGLTGNAGTTPGTNFIGTTDNQALVLKVNNKQALKITPANDDGFNYQAGNVSNTLDSGANGSVISGGGSSFSPNKLTENFSVIAGGTNNSIGGVTSNHEQGAYSVISGGVNNIIDLTNTNAQASLIAGGNNNRVSSSHTTISGGYNNYASGLYSVITGGQSNIAGGVNSFAAGNNANIRTAVVVGDSDGDEGSFVWSQTGVSTSGPNQVLFEALGGFGVGTNTPVSPMHIKGQGQTFGALVNEVVMTVEPKATTDDVSFAINKLDSSNESALAFTINQLPEFDIRTAIGGALDFNSYQSGSAKFMMRINNSSVDRIDINTNLEPQVAAAYDFGSSGFRWKHIYTEDITTRNTITTDSDRRIKDNIKNIDYGLVDILAMRPVSYNLKKGNTDQTHLGFIAQEIKAIVPEIVSQTDDEKHMLSMRYSEIIPILIKATQEQQVIIDQQSNDIARLEAMIEKILVLSESNK